MSVIKFPIDKARWSQDDLEAKEGADVLSKIYDLNQQFKEHPEVGSFVIEDKETHVIEQWNKQSLSKAYAEWKEKWGDNVPEVWEGRSSPRALEENK